MSGADLDAIQERAWVDTALLILQEVLATFHEVGHPGEPCVRSGWIPERKVQQWRDAVHALTGDADQELQRAWAEHQRHAGRGHLQGGRLEE